MSVFKKLTKKRHRDRDTLFDELQRHCGADSKVQQENQRLETVKESYKQKRDMQGHTTMKDKVEQLTKVKASLKELQRSVNSSEI